LEVKITFLCPACGKEVKSDASEAGRRCFCPHCSAEMLVPFIRLAGTDRQKALDMLTARGAEGSHAAPVTAADRRDSTRWGLEGLWAKIEGKGKYRVINLSSGGLAMELPVEATAQLGKLLELEIENPFKGGKVKVKAEVMWLTLLSAFDGETPVGDGKVEDKRYVRMGMAFKDVRPAQQKVIDEIKRSISQ